MAVFCECFFFIWLLCLYFLCVCMLMFLPSSCVFQACFNVCVGFLPFTWGPFWLGFSPYFPLSLGSSVYNFNVYLLCSLCLYHVSCFVLVLYFCFVFLFVIFISLTLCFWTVLVAHMGSFLFICSVLYHVLCKVIFIVFIVLL